MGFGGNTRGEQQDTQRLLFQLGRIADSLEQLVKAEKHQAETQPDQLAAIATILEDRLTRGG
jgi:hypothetical protein